MDAFAYTASTHRTDRELLDRLSHTLLVLKVDAQEQLGRYGLLPMEAERQRELLVEFLDALDARVRHRGPGLELSGRGSGDPAFTGLADRFIAYREDVSDRLDELGRLRGRLVSAQPLSPGDFRALDRLQRLLEEEAAEGTRGLYAL